jgi:hypothetical protein
MTSLRELGIVAGTVGFVLAWLAPLYIIAVSRRRVIHRRKDMAEALLAKAAGRSNLPADHYFKLFMPGQKRAGLSEVEKRDLLHGEFDRLHGGIGRYVSSVVILMLVSLVAFVLEFLRVLEIIRPKSPPRVLLWIGLDLDPEGLLSSLVSFGSAPGVLPALAGASVATLTELLLRSRAGDLTPDEIDECSLRYLIAIPVGRVMIALSGGVLDGVGAFLIAGLPVKDIQRYLRRRAHEKIGQLPSSDSDGLMTGHVDGLSGYATARLEELRIVTYTDLAYANPIRILARTGYPLRLIVQWIDHALLSIYARSHKAALRDAGLPCSLDVVEFWDEHFAGKSPDGKSGVVKDLADKVNLATTLIREIFQRVAIDPHVRFLRDLWYTEDETAISIGPLASTPSSTADKKS